MLLSIICEIWDDFDHHRYFTQTNNFYKIGCHAYDENMQYNNKDLENQIIRHDI
jgi:hypothetical protein